MTYKFAVTPNNAIIWGIKGLASGAYVTDYLKMLRSKNLDLKPETLFIRIVTESQQQLVPKLIPLSVIQNIKEHDTLAINWAGHMLKLEADQNKQFGFTNISKAIKSVLQKPIMFPQDPETKDFIKKQFFDSIIT